MKKIPKFSLYMQSTVQLGISIGLWLLQQFYTRRWHIWKSTHSLAIIIPTALCSTFHCVTTVFTHFAIMNISWKCSPRGCVYKPSPPAHAQCTRQQMRFNYCARTRDRLRHVRLRSRATQLSQHFLENRTVAFARLRVFSVVHTWT